MKRRNPPCIVAGVLATLAAPLLAGCQQKMANQPSYKTDDPCAFFTDGASSRHPVAGTVARGQLRIDTALYTGREADVELAEAAELPDTSSRTATTMQTVAAEAAQFQGIVNEFPFPITRDLLEHGRNRYLIYCVVCHDAAGTGHGQIVERGYTRPPSYHTDRQRATPVGHLYQVITLGYGSMPSYAGQVGPRDRWAIVAYVRALQLSQHYPTDKLPEHMQKEWEQERLTVVPGGQRP